jgi:hypothetical protein
MPQQPFSLEVQLPFSDASFGEPWIIGYTNLHGMRRELYYNYLIRNQNLFITVKLEARESASVKRDSK